MSTEEEKASLVPVDLSSLKAVSMYETQSESELLALSESLPVPDSKLERPNMAVERDTNPEKRESPPSAKMSNRSKRREKLLRNEPPNITGESIPSGINVMDFTEARATELKNMTHALERKQLGKLTSQKLPRHMRRRAASHNVKRLPRRCREAAAREMEKSKADGSVEKKARSRKHRRNTRNLQSSAAQKQRSNKWLKTHLWHAKRMKMVNKYGYRLSEHCADKGVRAAYKSFTHGCSMSDVSYYGCVEVTGLQDRVIKCLAPLFNSESGLTIAGKAFLSGSREGTAVVYKRGEYPSGAVGPVHFLWKAQPPDIPEDRQSTVIANEPTCLWLWSHPAMHKEVLSEVYDCIETFNPDTKMEETLVASAESEIELIKVQEVRDLARFRLIGPRSHALLMEVLKPEFDFEQTDLCEPSPDLIEIDQSVGHRKPRWWRGANQNSFYEHCRLVSEIHPSIKDVPSPAHFQKGSVLSLNVLDPRLNALSRNSDVTYKFYPLGKHQQVSVEENETEGMEFDTDQSNCKSTMPLQSLPVGVAYSPLWNSYIRVVVSNSKEPTQQINQLCSQQLVRSSKLSPNESPSKIPVILVQQTLNHISQQTCNLSNSNACGWDVILPSDWSREFWVSMVCHGARACGLEELKKCSLELQIQHFPNDYPDTTSGQTDCEKEKKHLMERYKRSPPDKRRNYGKFLVSAPFEFPWRELVKTWSRDSRLNRFCCPESPPHSKRMKLEIAPNEDLPLDACFPIQDSSMLGFYVLRSREVLLSLAQFVQQLFSKKYSKSSCVDLSDLEGSFKKSLNDHSIDKYLKVHSSAILGIRLQIYQRGKLSIHDVLSVPTLSDFVPLLSRSKQQPNSGPKEDIHPKGMTIIEADSLVIGVSSLSAKQITEVKEKRKNFENALKTIKGKDGETASALPVQKSAKEDFHLHPVQPRRETFGYVTSAGYRHTTSLYSGIGFCTFAGFLEILCRSYTAPGVCEPLALVRGSSTQYWFVKIQLL